MCSCRRTATRIGRRPLVQLCLHREYSGLRFTRGWPQIADIPPAASSFNVTAASTLDPFALYTAFPMLGLLRVLRPTPSASTGDRSSPLRTTRRRTSRDQRSGSHVHSRTLQRGRCPAMPLQPRHRYSAVVHRGLPGRRHQPAKEFPVRPRPAGTRCNPARICQVGAGGAILRGFRPLVPHVHLLVTLAGPTPSDSAGMSRRCRGCFRLHRCSPGSGCPQLQPVRCDGPMAVVFYHRRVLGRLVALYVRAPHLIRSLNRKPPQQIGIHPVLRVRDAGAWLAVDRFQAQQPHQPPHPVPTNPPPPRAPSGAPSDGCRRTDTAGTTRRCAASTPASARSRPPVGSRPTTGSVPAVGIAGSSSNQRAPVRSSACARPGSAPEPA